ncbi:hypothetical protein NDU88_008112, partial [Pleurodeles waltl]
MCRSCAHPMHLQLCAEAMLILCWYSCVQELSAGAVLIPCIYTCVPELCSSYATTA